MHNLTDITKLALLGQAVGDAFGAPFEYTRGDPEKYGHLSFKEKRYLDSVYDCSGKVTRWRMPGLYTDDTQQALMLLDVRQYEDDHAARMFMQMGRAMIREPASKHGVHRGTGRNYRDAVTQSKPVQTAGLGAAMRVGPVATTFDDPNHLIDWVINTARATTTSGLGIACAVKYAAVAWALSHPGRGDEFKDLDWPTDYIVSGEWDITTEALYKVRQGQDVLVEWAKPWSNKPMKIAANGFALTGFAWAIHAAMNSTSFEHALITATKFGGDTDTVGAMTGCLAALKHGRDSIPDWMVEKLFGKDHILDPSLWNVKVEKDLTFQEVRERRRLIAKDEKSKAKEKEPSKADLLQQLWEEEYEADG